MKINLRVKKLRQNLGLDFSSFVDILFEDFPTELRKQYNEDHLKQVEAGNAGVGILLVQQILMKFEVNAYRLINGIGQMHNDINAPKKEVIIQQRNTGSPDNTLRLNIIDDPETIQKLLAEKDVRLDKANSRIEQLEQTLFILTEVFSVKYGQEKKENSPPTKKSTTPKANTNPSHLLAAMMLLVFMTSGLLIIFKQSKPQETQSENDDFPRSIFYEKFIQKENKDSLNFILDYNAHHNRTTVYFQNLKSEIYLRVLDYREEIKLDKIIIPEQNQLSLQTYDWPRGVYYFVLALKDGEVVFVDSIIKK